MKAFKDYDISDFEDMGSLPKNHAVAHDFPFIPFYKTKKGDNPSSYKKHPISNLADVI